MRKSEFPKEQIAFVLQQVVSETTVAEVCRRMSIYEGDVRPLRAA